VSKTEVFQSFQKWVFHSRYARSEQELPAASSLRLNPATVVMRPFLTFY